MLETVDVVRWKNLARLASLAREEALYRLGASLWPATCARGVPDRSLRAPVAKMALVAECRERDATMIELRFPNWLCRCWRRRCSSFFSRRRC
jgi:hypothetical protein